MMVSQKRALPLLNYLIRAYSFATVADANSPSHSVQLKNRLTMGHRFEHHDRSKCHYEVTKTFTKICSPFIQLFSALLAISALNSPAMGYSIPRNQLRDLNRVEIITSSGRIGPSPIEILVMLLVVILGILVFTPVMGFSDRKRVLNVSLFLGFWVYWIVSGTDILPWSFVM